MDAANRSNNFPAAVAGYMALLVRDPGEATQFKPKIPAGKKQGKEVIPPDSKKGGKYLVEVVVRTLNLGHPLSQGTVDSNEIWVELAARQQDRVVGRSGVLPPWREGSSSQLRLSVLATVPVRITRLSS